jgi:membrane-associated protease RseP (regulator of RpoE activity)
MTDILEPTPKPPVPEPRRALADPKAGATWRVAILGALIVLAGVSGGWPLLVMIAALVVMIFLHELGHFLTAKWAGMKVTEFFIGFGPRIWSFHRGETEYGVKVIPAGAYVKIIGMHNLDEFDDADAERTYMSKPIWRRLSVAVAGSTMHFLLALGCLFVAFAFVGVPGGGRGSIVDPSWVVADNIATDSPAYDGGVRAGDEVRSVDGVDTTTFDRFREVVAARPGETVPVVVVRDGEALTVEVTLGDENPSTGEAIGFFGAAPDRAPPATVGLASAVGETGEAFGTLTIETFKGLGRILSPSGLADLGQRVLDSGDGGPAVVGSSPQEQRQQAEHDANRPISIVGVTQLGADVIGDDPGEFFLLFALVNMFIGVFNLVPLLPLDGGHVAIACYEKVRSMLRGGESYHVDVVKLLPITYAVVLVLAFIGLSTIFLDIADPIGS